VTADAVGEMTAETGSTTKAKVSDAEAMQDDSRVDVVDMAELQALDQMEMTTLEKWTAWSELRFVKQLEQVRDKKNHGENVEIGFEFFQQDSWLNDTISFVIQYLAADETTTPKPWKTEADKMKLQSLMERMRESSAKAAAIFREFTPEEDEGCEEEC